MKPVVQSWLARVLLLLAVAWLAACSEEADVEGESLRRAQFFLEDHQYHEAIFSAKKVLAYNPKNIAAYRVIGRALLANGQGAEAERVLRAAMKLGDGEPQTRVDVVRAMLLQGRAAAALRYSEEIRTEAEAQKAQLRLLRADAYLQLGGIEAARNAVRTALDQGAPRADALITLARINLADARADVALQMLDEVAAMQPEDPRLWHWRGQIALLQGRYEEAEAAFTRALEHDREPARRSRSVMGMMRAQIAQGKVVNALQFAEQLEYQVDRSLPDFMRGLELLRAGKLDEAESVLESVMERHPGDPGGGVLLGAINYRKGNYSLAESYLSDYVSADSSPLAARKMLAAIHLKQGRPREAFLLLKDTLDVELKDPSLDVLVGLAALGMGNYQLAEHHLTRAREHGRRSKTLLLALARISLFSGRPREAAALAEEVLAMDADSALARPLLVQAYLSLGQDGKALASARGWVRKAPYDTDMHLLHARTAAAVGRLDEAGDTLREALKIDSGNVEARLLLADLLRGQGKLEAARAQYQRVLGQQTDSATAAAGLLMSVRSAAEREAVLDVLQTHLQRHPDVSGPRLVLAQYYLARNMPPTAEKYLHEALALQPEMREGLYLLAEVRVAQGRIDDALAIYDQISAREPGSEMALVSKARLLLAKDRAREALPVAREAATLNPDSAAARIVLYQVARAVGDAALAKQTLADIGAKWPRQALAERLQADALMREGKPGEALAFYEAAWKKQPVQVVALNLFAARFRAGRQEAALAGLEEWLAAHPRDARARRLLANALQRSGKVPRAMHHYRLLLEQTPEDVTVLNNLAWLYMEAGDRRALELGKQAYAQAAGNPAVLDTWGMILLRFGRREEAVAILEEAARLAPDDAGIARHLAEARAGGA